VQSPTIDLVSVEFTHEDPDLASKLPNLLMTNYIEWAYGSIISELRDKKKFYEEQASACTNRLAGLVQQRTDFEVKHAGMFPDSPDMLQSRINTIHSDLDTLRIQQNKAKKDVARLESLAGVVAQNSDPSKPNVPKRPTQAEIEYAQLALRLQYAKQDLDTAILVKRYTELHPDVRKLRESIRVLEGRLAELEPKLPPDYEPPPEKGPMPRPENVEMALAAARSELDVTTSEIERLENRAKGYDALMANFTPVRQEYLDLVGKIKDKTEEADRWKSLRDQNQMRLDAEDAKKRTHLVSVETAERQFKPSSPALMKVLLLAYAGSLLFGGAIVFLLHALDRSISTTEDAAHYFNVPVHGVVGEIDTAKRRARRKLWRCVLWPAVIVVAVGLLAFATMSIALWLTSPDQFQQWRSAPVTFVWHHVTAFVARFLQMTKS
jgi:uncharacterized protein involved in exopolysaccharide biosynthesis